MLMDYTILWLMDKCINWTVEVRGLIISERDALCGISVNRDMFTRLSFLTPKADLTVIHRQVNNGGPAGTVVTAIACHAEATDSSAYIRRWSNFGLLLAHRLRRWPNSKPMLGQSLLFAASPSVFRCRSMK